MSGNSEALHSAEDGLLPRLPQHWRWATPEDIASSDRHALAIGPFGSNLKVSDYRDSGVPLVFVRNVRSGRFGGTATKYISREKADELRAHSVAPGDVLVTKMGDPPGDSAVYPSDQPVGIITADCIKITPAAAHACPRYLAYAIRSERVHRQIIQITKGVAQQKVSLGRFAKIKLPLSPLPEQRRIVAKIEELFSDLDAGVAALERVRANLKRYRASVLKAAVEGRLTEQWRAEHPDVEPAAVLLERILAERRARWEADQFARFEAAGKKPPKGWKDKYVEPAAPDTDELPALPGGWCWATIDMLASTLPRSVQSGPFGSNLHHSEFQDTGILAIGIDNVQNGGFSVGRSHRISSAKFEQLRKYAARPLDFVITVMATVGRCCVLPLELETAIITKHVYRVTLNRDIIDPYFLLAAVRGSTEVRRQLFGEVRGQTRPGINGEILRRIPIPVPPLAEQEKVLTEIDVRLSMVDPVEMVMAHSLRRSQKLRQSILKRAFEGKLVPQDSADGPRCRAGVRNA